MLNLKMPLSSWGKRPELRPGDVAMPEAGPGAYFRLTMADLEQLEDAFGGGDGTWFHNVLTALDRLEIGAVRKIAEIALKGGSVDRLMKSITVRDLAVREVDVVCLVLFGKSSDQIADDPPRFWPKSKGGANGGA